VHWFLGKVSCAALVAGVIAFVTLEVVPHGQGLVGRSIHLIAPGAAGLGAFLLVALALRAYQGAAVLKALRRPRPGHVAA
jgi:hypothetical protein